MCPVDGRGKCLCLQMEAEGRKGVKVAAFKWTGAVLVLFSTGRTEGKSGLPCSGRKGQLRCWKPWGRDDVFLKGRNYAPGAAGRSPRQGGGKQARDLWGPV